MSAKRDQSSAISSKTVRSYGVHLAREFHALRGEVSIRINSFHWIPPSNRLVLRCKRAHHRFVSKRASVRIKKTPYVGKRAIIDRSHAGHRTDGDAFAGY
jgi:hypothetical protein